MAFKAFYDGSGKSDASEAITLTGVAASESVWAEFEPRWEAALAENDVDWEFHMSDFMCSGHGRFSDWQDEQKRKLFASLYNAIAAFRSREGYAGLFAYSSTVMMAGYRKAKAEIPSLRPPEAICVNFSFGAMGLPPGESEILLYFDRNEAFMHQINRVWLRLKKKGKGWPAQVRNIVPVDHSYYPIQAADLLAWTVNRHHLQGGAFPTRYWMTFLMVEHPTTKYDYDEIVKQYPNG